MGNQVYSDPAFAEAARGFVAVHINYDKKTALARKYNVSELPTLIYTDSFGSELFRHSGFLDGRSFIDLLHSLPSDVSGFNRLDQILLQNKNDFEALKAMGAKLGATGLFLASNEYYARALQTKEAKIAASERGTILAAMGKNSLEVKDGKEAADAFEKCLKERSGSQQSAICALGLGHAYTLSNKKDKARTVLEEVVRNHPGTAESQQAEALLNSF